MITTVGPYCMYVVCEEVVGHTVRMWYAKRVVGHTVRMWCVKRLWDTLYIRMWYVKRLWDTLYICGM